MNMTPERKDKPMKEISLHGGFGDVVQLIPYLKIYKDNNPEERLKVYYREDDTPSDPRIYSGDTARLMTDQHGNKYNSRYEILERLPFVDELEAQDYRKKQSGEYYDPLTQARKLGWQASPTWFTENITPFLFNDSDRLSIDNLWKKHNLHNKFIISIHFRRSLKEINRLYQLIVKSEEIGDDVRIIMMGSTEHQIIPPKLDKSLSLVDSYCQGLGLMEVLLAGIRSSLYIGGRGGFEIFFWLNMVPSINIFDGIGKEFLQEPLWWPESYWKENAFKGGPIIWDELDINQELENKIIPLYHKWKKEKKQHE